MLRHCPSDESRKLYMTVSGISSIPFGELSQEAPQTATQNAMIKLLNGSVASSLGSASLSLSRLGSAATSIVTNAINYEGNVALSVSGLPFGVNYTLSPATIPGTGSSSLVIKAASTAKPGTYTIIVKTAAGGAVALSALTLTIS
jgi:hypothetical protein